MSFGILNTFAPSLYAIFSPGKAKPGSTPGRQTTGSKDGLFEKALPSKCEMKTVQIPFSFGDAGYFLQHISKSPHRKKQHMNINRATGCTCKQSVSLEVFN